MEYLAGVLKSNQTITTLDLSDNQIRSTGAQYLAHALTDNHVIIFLSLFALCHGSCSVM